MTPPKTWTVPNILTLARILITPVIALLPFINGYWPKLLCFVIFIAAAVTDVIDGRIARRNNQITDFGKLLDPIADKLLVAAVLLMLCANATLMGVSIWAAVVILCREILVSGLREYLAELRVAVPVTRVAKWKTTAQLVALGFLIAGPAAERAIPGSHMLGVALLWIAAVLTLYTGWDYMRASYEHVGGEV